MRKYIPILIALVLAAAFLAAAVSSAAGNPQQGAAAPPPPARQIAVLKRQVRDLQSQLAAARSAITKLRDANAALSPSGIAKRLAQVKAVNDKYRSVDAAKADGYVPASPCESSPAGGMGIHYLNPAASMDSTIDPLKPEVLLYAPTAGGLELVGVEYFKADADQDLSTDGDRPSVFGRAFDGPMLGHSPTMPKHFDLHVWLWKHNPTGMFAQWNPDVHCS